MNEAYAILDSFLAEQNSAVDRLSATSLGFRASKTLRPDWLGDFVRSLIGNRDAFRLLWHEGLGRELVKLAGFVAFGVSASPKLETRLAEGRKERGDDLKAKLRTAGRKGQRSGQDVSGHHELLVRAGKAFDTRRTRRKGRLARHCEVAFVLRGYIRARCGFTPTPRELTAILEAGQLACGMPDYVDSDLLGRNMKSFEKRNRAHCARLQEEAVSIVEGRIPVTALRS